MASPKVESQVPYYFTIYYTSVISKVTGRQLHGKFYFYTDDTQPFTYTSLIRV